MPTYKLTWRDSSRPQDPDNFPEDASPEDLITYTVSELHLDEGVPLRLLSLEAALHAAGYKDIELLVKEETWKVPLDRPRTLAMPPEDFEDDFDDEETP